MLGITMQLTSQLGGHLMKKVLLKKKKKKEKTKKWEK